jgi:hypothetical protein
MTLIRAEAPRGGGNRGGYEAVVFVTCGNKREGGRVMAQAVSHRPLTAEERVLSRVSPRGICGGQSGTGTVLRFSPVSFIPPVLH